VLVFVVNVVNVASFVGANFLFFAVGVYMVAYKCLMGYGVLQCH
jgi:hypothetical protein